jgi:hypothetical protein
LVSASVLFDAATTFDTSCQHASLGSVGQISEALIPYPRATIGRLVFSFGVLGASMVDAIVCSLAWPGRSGRLPGIGARPTPSCPARHGFMLSLPAERWWEQRLPG